MVNLLSTNLIARVVLVLCLFTSQWAASLGANFASNSAELAQLVSQANVSTIILSNSFKLSLADWGNAGGTPENARHVVTGRNLTLRGAEGRLPRTRLVRHIVHTCRKVLHYIVRRQLQFKWLEFGLRLSLCNFASCKVR